MKTETDTPRTDALMPDQGQKRTMLEHIEAMEAHARQLERELNEAKYLLRLILPDWADKVDQPYKNKVCAEITQYDVVIIRDFLNKTKLTTETK